MQVTRHFTDDYAPIDLEIAFTEAEQRLSKRSDKRPIDVPIDPCQSNEKVLQHLSFSSVPPAEPGWSAAMERRYSYSGFAAQVYLKELGFVAGKLFVFRFSM